ncbi:MAG: 30S ribosome-binding factor RbfA [Planctomycetaceae bacterium]|nr:30S ribosome-binding factor RbfA [Planctomycetaceae bacterium]MCB9950982.1 30S ribosome-binding factor RbfA [Planctomycetaceae bacterium]
MSTRRTARVAEAIRQVVSSAILLELRDPRAKNITVLHVEVPADLRTAKVYVTVRGDKKTEVLSMQGLNSARGFLQAKIADELDLRYTPILTFVVDPGVKKSIEVSRMLRELNAGEDNIEDSLDDLPDGVTDDEIEELDSLDDESE